MPSFIRHGPTIPRRGEVALPEPIPASSYPSAGPEAGPPHATKSFLRQHPQRSAQEVALRASQRLSAPPYGLRGPGELPLEYAGSQQSFLPSPGPMGEAENGGGDVGGGRFYYADGPASAAAAIAPGYYRAPQGLRRPPPLQLPPPERFHDDYRYYEHHASEHPFSRMPPHTPPPAQTRPPAGKAKGGHGKEGG